MTNLLLFGLGVQELLLILAIVLLLFGSTRLPRLAKGLGQSIKEFKRGVNQGEADEIDEAAPAGRLTATRTEVADDLAVRRVGANETR